MSFDPVREARIDFDDAAAPRSPDYGDIYHPRAGALQQAEHVYLRGSGLPGRWQGRARFVILETGFGLGHNLLATWDAWRRDPGRCERLWFISIDKHPPRRDDLARAHAHSPLADLAATLLAAWPPATPDFHRIDLAGGQLSLLLAWADVAQALRELTASVDAFFLDGFAPERNPDMWQPHALRHLRRLAAPQASVATWTVAGAVRETLRAAGFAVHKAPGSGGKREITLGRFAPHHVAEAPPGRRAGALGQAVVVGAGLAGAMAARALAQAGISTTVLERQRQPATQASGNAAGLYHGVIHGALHGALHGGHRGVNHNVVEGAIHAARHLAAEGAHARWLRAAALHAHRCYAPLVAQGLVAGQTAGLLRGARDLPWADMHASLAALGLPAAWAEALTPEQAAQRGGLRCANPAWLMHHAGWVAPADLVRHALATPGVQWRGGVNVQALRRRGERWQLLGGQGLDGQSQVLAEAEHVVLANAADAVRLLGRAPGAWLLQRGQVSQATLPGHALPLPLADGSCAVDLGGNQLLFGATAQADDDDPLVRDDDHRHNLARLQQLTGWALPDVAPGLLQGRVGWRLQTIDRLPWIGPTADEELLDAASAAAAPRSPSTLRLDQPRFVPRRAGLHVLAGLGSRGLTHAPLAAELLAAWISGAPLPVPSRLVDAVDVARFAARQQRRG